MISLIRDEGRDALEEMISDWNSDKEIHIDDVLKLMLSDNAPDCFKEAAEKLANAFETVIIQTLLLNCLVEIKNKK